MKKAKKILVMVAALALTAALAIGGTLAYLTSTTEVVQNTFTVGKVKISLDETDVDLYGVKDGETRVLKNEYKLMPGHEYIKDPMVTVKADSEESYVRMLLTINCQAVLDEIFAPGVALDSILTGYDASKWVLEGATENGDSKTYEFRYYETVETVDDTEDLPLEPLFTKIEMPGDITNEELAKLEDLQLDVIAHAIQADGFADADAAWAAFTA